MRLHGKINILLHSFQLLAGFSPAYSICLHLVLCVREIHDTMPVCLHSMLMLSLLLRYRGEDKIKDCKDGDYSLTLSNLSQADAGKYTLVAKNLVGETSAYAKLSVLGMSSCCLLIMKRKFPCYF